MSAPAVSSELLVQYADQHGKTLAAWASERPLLLVFLRHFG